MAAAVAAATPIIPNLPRSFADVLSGKQDEGSTSPRALSKSFQNVFTTGGGKVQVKAPKTFKGEPAVFFSKEDIANLASPFRFTLIGKFSHWRPSMEIIRKFFSSLGLKSLKSVGLLQDNHVVIFINNEEDYSRLLLRSMWYISGSPMKIMKWTPDFVSNCESSIVPVWVCFPGLPIHFFEKSALFNIALAFGNPLKIDEPTANLTRPTVARVCIELDVSKPKNNRLWIGEEKEGYWQDVIFEDPPVYCDFCKILGHEESVCFIKNPELKISKERIKKDEAKPVSIRSIPANVKMGGSHQAKSLLFKDVSTQETRGEEDWNIVKSKKWKKKEEISVSTSDSILVNSKHPSGLSKGKEKVFAEEVALTPFNPKKFPTFVFSSALNEGGNPFPIPENSISHSTVIKNGGNDILVAAKNLQSSVVGEKEMDLLQADAIGTTDSEETVLGVAKATVGSPAHSRNSCLDNCGLLISYAENDVQPSISNSRGTHTFIGNPKFNSQLVGLEGCQALSIDTTNEERVLILGKESHLGVGKPSLFSCINEWAPLISSSGFDFQPSDYGSLTKDNLLFEKEFQFKPSTSSSGGPHTCFVEKENNLSHSLTVVDCQTKLAETFNEERVFDKERDYHVADISSASEKNICGANQFQSSTFPSGSHLPFGDLNIISHSLVSEDCKTTTLNSLYGGSHKECGIKGNDVPISHATTTIFPPLVSKELPIQPFSSNASGPNNASRDHVLVGENNSQSSFGPNSLVDNDTSQVGQTPKQVFNYPPNLFLGGPDKTSDKGGSQVDSLGGPVSLETNWPPNFLLDGPTLNVCQTNMEGFGFPRDGPGTLDLIEKKTELQVYLGRDLVTNSSGLKELHDQSFLDQGEKVHPHYCFTLLQSALFSFISAHGFNVQPAAHGIIVDYFSSLSASSEESRDGEITWFFIQKHLFNFINGSGVKFHKKLRKLLHLFFMEAENEGKSLSDFLEVMEDTPQVVEVDPSDSGGSWETASHSSSVP